MDSRFSEVAGWFRQLIMQDIFRKAVALLLAVFLYLCVKSQEQLPQQVIQNVPVSLQLPEGMVNQQKNDFKVQLYVRGSKRRLEHLTAESFKAVCPVTADGKVALNAEMFLPKHSGVTIERIEPSEFDLKLDKIVSRCLPVQPSYRPGEQLPAGYEICKASAEPKEVTVSGLSRVVGGLQEVYTKPIPLNGSPRESFYYPAELKSLDGVRMQPDRVTMYVEIRRRTQGERSLSGIPCHLLLSSEQRRAFSADPVRGMPSAADVVVRGTDEARAALRPDSIRVFADLTGLKSPGEYTVPLNGVLLTPEAKKLELVRISPKQLKVVIRRSPEK